MAKPIPVFAGVIDAEGRLRLDARGLFDRYLRTLKQRAVSVTVKVAGRATSTNQRGYLFGVLYPVIAEEIGYREYEIDAVHDACMRRLRGLKPEPNPLQLRVSLRDFDHTQTSAYIEDLRHWALTEFGIVTPDADKAEAA